MNGACVYVTPHRRFGAELRPGVTVGETDFATDRPLSARRPQVTNRPGDTVGVSDLESGITGSKRCDLASCSQGRKHLIGNRAILHQATSLFAGILNWPSLLTAWIGRQRRRSLV